jgi:aminoglycoside 3-N-acetyltransferase
MKTCATVEILPKDELGRSLVTCGSLVAGLQQAGISEGDIVCAHVGLKPLGFVVGAGQAIIEALLQVIGPTGTLMMPTFSGELSDPASWRVPPVPQEWIAPIREQMLPYDIIMTPTRQMGVVAELFRHRPGALRSAHPHSSFCALGARAHELIAHHPLNYRFGVHSPLGRLAAFDGKVILLGAAENRASYVYLAQYCAGLGDEVVKSAPILKSGNSHWISYRDVIVDNRIVESGVRRLLDHGLATRTGIGDGSAIVFGAREALHNLVLWLGGADRPFGVAQREAIPLPKNWNDWLPATQDNKDGNNV